MAKTFKSCQQRDAFFQAISRAENVAKQIGAVMCSHYKELSLDISKPNMTMVGLNKLLLTTKQMSTPVLSRCSTMSIICLHHCAEAPIAVLWQSVLGALHKSFYQSLSRLIWSSIAKLKYQTNWNKRAGVGKRTGILKKCTILGEKRIKKVSHRLVSTYLNNFHKVATQSCQHQDWTCTGSRVWLFSWKKTHCKLRIEDMLLMEEIPNNHLGWC